MFVFISAARRTKLACGGGKLVGRLTRCAGAAAGWLNVTLTYVVFLPVDWPAGQPVNGLKLGAADEAVALRNQ